MRLPRYLFFILPVFLASSCDTPVQYTSKDNTEELIKESFVETNQYIRERNREHIIAFAERMNWHLKETSTGLWYEILDVGDGERVRTGKFVTYTYTTRLLTGKLCYSADTLKPKSIVVGKGNIEAGLEEGLLLLRENSRARFLIPPYLAYGNFGDRDQIPGSAVVWIEVNILDVKR